MLTLYTAVKSPGVLVEWALKELNIPHRVKFLDLQTGENRSPEYLKVIPMGMVPALRDGDLRLVESGAILLYLQDKYGGKTTDTDHVAILQWDPAVTSGNLDRMEALLFKLDKHLIGKQYIAGNRFTVADVAIGGSLLIISTCMPYVIPRFFHKAVECHGSEFSLGSGAFTLDGTIEFARFPRCNLYIKELIERHPVPIAEASSYNSPITTMNPIFA